MNDEREELQPMTWQEAQDNSGKILRDNLSQSDLNEVKFGLVIRTVGLIMIASIANHVPHIFIAITFMVYGVHLHQTWVEVCQQSDKHKNYFEEQEQTE